MGVVQPLRYLSRNACKNEDIIWEELLEYYRNKEYMIEIICDFKRMEEWIKKLDLFGAVYYLRKTGGYEKYLKEINKEK